MQDVGATLRQVSLLAAAADPDLERLAAASFSRRLRRGQVLFLEGEVAEHLYVVVRGRLKVMATSADGGELVLAVVGAGEPLGELSVLDGAERSADAVALEDVELCCVPAEAVRALLERSPGVALAVARELAGRLRRLTGSAADLVFLDLPRRLAKLLTSEDGDGVAGLAQSELAARLGVTRQSLNRALQRLQGRGWVEVHRGGVEVVDRPALVHFAQS